ISVDDFPPGHPERIAIQDAIDFWQANTNVRFRPRTDELHYVRFVAGKEANACRSDVGVQQAGSTVPVAQRIFCDLGSGALVHEIGHALGLWHEHAREDRDAFITVHRENIMSDNAGDLDQHVSDGTVVGDYDYDSVMHYRVGQFAIRWRPAVPLPDQAS